MAILSAFADEVTDDFSEQLSFLVSEDIQYIEIRFVNQKNILELNRNELVETKRMLDDSGIGVSAIGSPIGKVGINEPFMPHLEKFKHAVELADFFDSYLIRIFSYYAPPGASIDNYRAEVLKRMKQKAALLEGTDIIMVHENETGIYGSSAEKCVDMVKSVGSRNFKLAYDPANFVWGQKISNNVEVCWPLMKKYVTHIHIKDWKLNSADIGSLPGQGDAQIKKLLTELVTNRYAGFVTIEPHLKSGGQYGGETGPEFFKEAIVATRDLCKQVGLKCD